MFEFAVSGVLCGFGFSKLTQNYDSPNTFVLPTLKLKNCPGQALVSERGSFNSLLESRTPIPPQAPYLIIFLPCQLCSDIISVNDVTPYYVLTSTPPFRMCGDVTSGTLYRLHSHTETQSSVFAFKVQTK